MSPITEVVPKPLLPFMGIPIIDIAVAKLCQAGIKEVAINTHHLSDKIIEHHYQESTNITFFHEPLLLGTGGGIKSLEGWLQGDDLLVYNGDIVTDADLRSFIASFCQNSPDSFASMLLLQQPAYGKNPVRVRSDHALLSIGDRKSSAPWHSFTGIHIVSNRLIKCMPEGYSDIIDHYKSCLEKGQTISTQFHNGFWCDLGTPEEYWHAHCLFRLLTPSQQLNTLHSRLDKVADDANFIDRSCVVSKDVSIDSPVYLFGDSKIGSGACLSNCIVSNSTIADQRNVNRKIVIADQTLDF